MTTLYSDVETGVETKHNSDTDNDAAAVTPLLSNSEDDAEWQAAQHSSLEAVQNYLEKRGFNSVEASKWQRNELFWAAQHGFLHVVRWLIEKKGFNPTQANYHGYTPLLMAAMGGQTAVIQYLVRICGTDIPSARTDEICSSHSLSNAAHLAAENGHLQTLKYLLKEQPFGPNTRNNSGDTALFVAAENGHLHIVRWLVEEYGLDVLNARINNHNSNAADSAAFYGHFDVVKYLASCGLMPRSVTIGSEAGPIEREQHAAAVKPMVECLIRDYGFDPYKITFALGYRPPQDAESKVDDDFETEKLKLVRLHQEGSKKRAALAEKIAAEGKAAQDAIADPSTVLDRTRTSMAHFSPSIYVPLSELLNDSQTLENPELVAKFFGQIVLNQPLISLDQFQQKIDTYLEQNNLDPQRSHFASVLTEISKLIQSKREVVCTAHYMLEQAVRWQEQIEFNKKNGWDVEGDPAEKLNQKYDDIHLLVKEHGVIILQCAHDKTGKTLGESVAPHLKAFLERLDKKTADQLKKVSKERWQQDVIKSEYIRIVDNFIKASGLPQDQKNKLYERCAKSPLFVKTNGGCFGRLFGSYDYNEFFRNTLLEKVERPENVADASYVPPSFVSSSSSSSRL